MRRNQTKSTSYKKWIFIIIGVLLFFPLYRFIRKQLLKNKEQMNEILKDKQFLANQDEPTLNNTLNTITKRKDIQAAAKDLAHHLGTKYSDKNSWFDWLDPKGWTENDDEVEKILIYQRKNYGLLVLLYKQITNSRSLSNDIRSYLDDDNLLRVRKYLNI
ncbi:hypothetical protein [Flavobacterium sp.]|uniref:hypothetical protein n=1 Tax=Flavobacterium sp. TaxID=239 RepID=UPI0022C816E7|nr:hypothetical protein [Flavobacterium sp.]MCZ8168773.1 hypothetical protein [Flavobacterium sp.]